MVTGTNMAYVAGDGHRPIPKADDLLYRRAHAPQPKKPSGLDWDALTPRCRECGEKSRQLNNVDTCPTCVAPVPVVEPASVPKKAVAQPRRPPAPRTPRPARQPRTGPRGPQSNTNVTEIRRLYLEEHLTIAAVSAAVNNSRGTVRKVLLDAGVTLRDDRKTNSGGKVKEYAPQFVADIRRLYLDEGLTQAETAERLVSTQKVIQTVMARHGIPARPDASSPGGQRCRVNPIDGLKARIAELGVTSREIKEWAVREGHLMGMQVGVPPARLVDAYAVAHPSTEGDI